MMDAHATRVVVWDVPAAVEPGAAVRVKVGVKCAADCSSAGRRVEVRDEQGHVVASGAVGSAPWPGTSALYYAELELRAPEAEGLHAREVAVAADEGAGDQSGQAGPGRWRGQQRSDGDVRDQGLTREPWQR